MATSLLTAGHPRMLVARTAFRFSRSRHMPYACGISLPVLGGLIGPAIEKRRYIETRAERGSTLSHGQR